MLARLAEGWLFARPGRAVVSVRRLRLSGFAGWLIWLFIHVGFLTGYRSRAGALLSWWLASTRDQRRERTFTTSEVRFRPGAYQLRSAGSARSARPARSAGRRPG